MDALTALIPAFKSFRASLAAGGVWLLAIVIAVQPRVSRASAPLRHIWGAVQALGDIASGVLGLVGVLAAAYVLGLLSDAVFGALSRWLTIKAVWLQRQLAELLPFLEAGAWWRGARKAATIEDFLETALGREWSREPVGRDRTRAARRVARDRIREQVRITKDALHHASDAATSSELDELWGDAAYRLQLVMPILALGASVAFYLPAVWAAVTAVSVIAAALAVAAGANNYAEKANDALARWAHGPVHPSSTPPTSATPVS